MSEFDIQKYTRRRMRQIKGQELEHEPMDPLIEKYTSRRIREIKVEHEMAQRKINLDNVALGGYTVVTMEVYAPDEQ